MTVKYPNSSSLQQKILLSEKVDRHKDLPLSEAAVPALSDEETKTFLALLAYINPDESKTFKQVAGELAGFRENTPKFAQLRNYFKGATPDNLRAVLDNKELNRFLRSGEVTDKNATIGGFAAVLVEGSRIAGAMGAAARLVAVGSALGLATGGPPGLIAGSVAGGLTSALLSAYATVSTEYAESGGRLTGYISGLSPVIENILKTVRENTGLPISDERIQAMSFRLANDFVHDTMRAVDDGRLGINARAAVLSLPLVAAAGALVTAGVFDGLSPDDTGNNGNAGNTGNTGNTVKMDNVEAVDKGEVANGGGRVFGGAFGLAAAGASPFGTNWHRHGGQLGEIQKLLFKNLGVSEGAYNTIANQVNAEQITPVIALFHNQLQGVMQEIQSEFPKVEIKESDLLTKSDQPVVHLDKSKIYTASGGGARALQRLAVANPSKTGQYSHLIYDIAREAADLKIVTNNNRLAIARNYLNLPEAERAQHVKTALVHGEERQFELFKLFTTSLQQTGHIKAGEKYWLNDDSALKDTAVKNKWLSRFAKAYEKYEQANQSGSTTSDRAHKEFHIELIGIAKHMVQDKESSKPGFLKKRALGSRNEKRREKFLQDFEKKNNLTPWTVITSVSLITSLQNKSRLQRLEQEGGAHPAPWQPSLLKEIEGLGVRSQTSHQQYVGARPRTAAEHMLVDIPKEQAKLYDYKERVNISEDAKLASQLIYEFLYESPQLQRERESHRMDIVAMSDAYAAKAEPGKNTKWMRQAREVLEKIGEKLAEGNELYIDQDKIDHLIKNDTELREAARAMLKNHEHSKLKRGENPSDKMVEGWLRHAIVKKIDIAARCIGEELDPAGHPHDRISSASINAMTKEGKPLLSTDQIVCLSAAAKLYYKIQAIEKDYQKRESERTSSTSLSVEESKDHYERAMNQLLPQVDRLRGELQLHNEHYKVHADESVRVDAYNNQHANPKPKVKSQPVAQERVQVVLPQKLNPGKAIDTMQSFIDLSLGGKTDKAKQLAKLALSNEFVTELKQEFSQYSDAWNNAIDASEREGGPDNLLRALDDSVRHADSDPDSAQDAIEIKLKIEQKSKQAMLSFLQASRNERIAQSEYKVANTDARRTQLAGQIRTAKSQQAQDVVFMLAHMQSIAKGGDKLKSPEDTRAFNETKAADRFLQWVETQEQDGAVSLHEFGDDFMAMAVKGLVAKIPSLNGRLDLASIRNNAKSSADLAGESRNLKEAMVKRGEDESSLASLSEKYVQLLRKADDARRLQLRQRKALDTFATFNQYRVQNQKDSGPNMTDGHPVSPMADLRSALTSVYPFLEGRLSEDGNVDQAQLVASAQAYAEVSKAPKSVDSDKIKQRAFTRHVENLYSDMAQAYQQQHSSLSNPESFSQRQSDLLNAIDAINTNSDDRDTTLNTINRAGMQAILDSNPDASRIIGDDALTALDISATTNPATQQKRVALKPYAYQKTSFADNAMAALESKFPFLQEREANDVLRNPVRQSASDASDHQQWKSLNELTDGEMENLTVDEKNAFARSLGRMVHRVQQQLPKGPSLELASQQYRHVSSEMAKEGQQRYFDGRPDRLRDMVVAEASLLNAIEAQQAPASTSGVAAKRASASSISQPYRASARIVNDLAAQIARGEDFPQLRVVGDRFESNFSGFMIETYPTIVDQKPWNQPEDVVNKFQGMAKQEQQKFVEQFNQLRALPPGNLNDEQLSLLAEGAVALRHTVSANSARQAPERQREDAFRVLNLLAVHRSVDLEPQLYLGHQFTDRAFEAAETKLGASADGLRELLQNNSLELQKLYKEGALKNLQAELYHIIQKGNSGGVLSEREQLVIAASIAHASDEIQAQQPGARRELARTAFDDYLADKRKQRAPGKALYPYSDFAKRLKEAVVDDLRAQGRTRLADRLLQQEPPRKKESASQKADDKKMAFWGQRALSGKHGAHHAARSVKAVARSALKKNSSTEQQSETSGNQTLRRVRQNMLGLAKRVGGNGRAALRDTDAKAINEVMRRAVRAQAIPTRVVNPSQAALNENAPPASDDLSVRTIPVNEAFKARETEQALLFVAEDGSVEAARLESLEAAPMGPEFAAIRSAVGAANLISKKAEWNPGVLEGMDEVDFELRLAGALKKLSRSSDMLSSQTTEASTSMDAMDGRAPTPMELARSFLIVTDQHSNDLEVVQPEDIDRAGQFVALIGKTLKSQKRLDEFMDNTKSQRPDYLPNELILRQLQLGDIDYNLNERQAQQVQLELDARPIWFFSPAEVANLYNRLEQFPEVVNWIQDEMPRRSAGQAEPSSRQGSGRHLASSFSSPDDQTVVQMELTAGVTEHLRRPRIEARGTGTTSPPQGLVPEEIFLGGGSHGVSSTSLLDGVEGGDAVEGWTEPFQRPSSASVIPTAARPETDESSSSADEADFDDLAAEILGDERSISPEHDVDFDDRTIKTEEQVGDRLPAEGASHSDISFVTAEEGLDLTFPDSVPAPSAPAPLPQVPASTSSVTAPEPPASTPAPTSPDRITATSRLERSQATILAGVGVSEGEITAHLDVRTAVVNPANPGLLSAGDGGVARALFNFAHTKDTQFLQKVRDARNEVSNREGRSIGTGDVVLTPFEDQGAQLLIVNAINTSTDRRHNVEPYQRDQTGKSAIGSLVQKTLEKIQGYNKAAARQDQQQKETVILPILGGDINVPIGVNRSQYKKDIVREILQGINDFQRGASGINGLGAPTTIKVNAFDTGDKALIETTISEYKQEQAAQATRPVIPRPDSSISSSSGSERSGDSGDNPPDTGAGITRSRPQRPAAAPAPAPSADAATSPATAPAPGANAATQADIGITRSQSPQQSDELNAMTLLFEKIGFGQTLKDIVAEASSGELLYRRDPQVFRQNLAEQLLTEMNTIARQQGKREIPVSVLEGEGNPDLDTAASIRVARKILESENGLYSSDHFSSRNYSDQQLLRFNSGAFRNALDFAQRVVEQQQRVHQQVQRQQPDHDATQPAPRQRPAAQNQHIDTSRPLSRVDVSRVLDNPGAFEFLNLDSDNFGPLNGEGRDRLNEFMAMVPRQELSEWVQKLTENQRAILFGEYDVQPQPQPQPVDTEDSSSVSAQGGSVSGPVELPQELNFLNPRPKIGLQHLGNATMDQQNDIREFYRSHAERVGEEGLDQWFNQLSAEQQQWLTEQNLTPAVDRLDPETERKIQIRGICLTMEEYAQALADGEDGSEQLFNHVTRDEFEKSWARAISKPRFAPFYDALDRIYPEGYQDKLKAAVDGITVDGIKTVNPVKYLNDIKLTQVGSATPEEMIEAIVNGYALAWKIRSHMSTVPSEDDDSLRYSSTTDSNNSVDENISNGWNFDDEDPNLFDNTESHEEFFDAVQEEIVDSATHYEDGLYFFDAEQDQSDTPTRRPLIEE